MEDVVFMIHKTILLQFYSLLMMKHHCFLFYAFFLLTVNIVCIFTLNSLYFFLFLTVTERSYYFPALKEKWFFAPHRKVYLYFLSILRRYKSWKLVVNKVFINLFWNLKQLTNIKVFVMKTLHFLFVYIVKLYSVMVKKFLLLVITTLCRPRC